MPAHRRPRPRRSVARGADKRVLAALLVSAVGLGFVLVGTKVFGPGPAAPAVGGRQTTQASGQAGALPSAMITGVPSPALAPTAAMSRRPTVVAPTASGALRSGSTVPAASPSAAAAAAAPIPARSQSSRPATTSASPVPSGTPTATPTATTTPPSTASPYPTN